MNLYRHCVDLCARARIGANGFDDLQTLPETAAAKATVMRLREAYENSSLALLRLPYQDNDFKEIEFAAARLRQTTDVVFLGTGGSSLGGQALVQIGGWHVPGYEAFGLKPRLHFFDNLDEQSFSALLNNIALASTHFVIISKSGGTAETLVQTLLVIARLQRAGLAITDHCLGITEPANWKVNPLRDLLASYNVQMLEHDTAIGGRYSALTNVGLLPAAVAGLDIRGIRTGARAVIDQLLNEEPDSFAPALGAALMMAFNAQGIHENVLMAYGDRLERFTAWFVQLWAESLGKDGKGTTPIRALGPVDQHSQLQLFLDGPANKVFTVISAGYDGDLLRIDEDLARTAGLEEFASKSIFDLTRAQTQATAETLAKRGRPVRRIHVEKLDEKSVGALMMHFFLETIISADILKIDAFDQPAVEEGKILAKAYLGRS